MEPLPDSGNASRPGARAEDAGSGCKGDDCAKTSRDSESWKPNVSFPHSTTGLTDGGKPGATLCNEDRTFLALFPHKDTPVTSPVGYGIYTVPEQKGPPIKSDTLTLYWTICNYGDEAGSDYSGSPPMNYTLTVGTKGSVAPPVFSKDFALPALAHCHCDLQTVKFTNQFLPTGTYRAELSGAFNAQGDFQIATP